MGSTLGLTGMGIIRLGHIKTVTASVTSSAGAGGGLLFAFSNYSVDYLSGPSSGGNAGIDTPVADVMFGSEVFRGIEDGVWNLSITVGPEVSAGAVVGFDTTGNYTFTQNWYTQKSSRE